MDDHTVKYLNQLNQQFYQITADHFDQSRGEPWPGWERLLPHLSTPLSILDVGCGNGRFGVFLADRLGAGVTYHGMDSSPTLLERGRAALAGQDTHLEERDVIEHPLDSGEYDLVVAFGMLHHVPGSQRRQEFLATLAQRVVPGGLLAFAAWRFYDYQRFRDRIVPWPDGLKVEPHDYLLDWRRGVHALRYCHYIDDNEHADLIAATGFTEIATYRADGRTRNMNRYSLLRRECA